MIDRMSIMPDRVYLRPQALLNNATVMGYRRKHSVTGKNKPNSAVFQILVNDNYPILTLVANPTETGRWLIKKIDFCPASLIHGHNARILRVQNDLHLALTRLMQFVAGIVEEDCLIRVVPGMTSGSSTYIHSVELMTQFEDKDHRLLRASHYATRPRQQFASIIQYGTYCKIPGKEIEIRIYDKKTRNSGRNSKSDGQSTRAEVVLKRPVRLAKCFPEVIGTESRSGSPVMKTITFDDCYRSLRRELLSLTGFGSVLDLSEVDRHMHKVAKLLLIGLGERVNNPTEICRVLDEYRRFVKPCSKTFNQVSKSLRANAVRRLFPSIMDVLPESIEDFHGCDIERRDVEREFESLLETFHCTETVDRDIAAAWSHSSYLLEKPKFTDVFRKKNVGIAPQFGSSL